MVPSREQNAERGRKQRDRKGDVLGAVQ